jgi:hypothetical protein
MKKLVSRRPSPAMALAFVALVAALSGTAIALPGRNGVDSGDIRNGAVKSADIKNNNVRGKDIRNGGVGSADVKNDGLTGADISESSLSKVPSAAAADTATRATSAGATDGFQRFRKTASATEGADFDAARGAAPEVALATAGPFALYGKCFEDTAGDADETNDTVYAFTYIRTSEAGSLLDGETDGLDGDPFLDPSTDEVERELVDTNASDDTADYSGNGDAEISAVAPSGAQVTALLAVGALNGDVTGGPGAYGASDGCVFNGSVFG